MADDIPYREKFSALLEVARYRPTLTAGIVGFGVFAALLEGVGLSFIVPIVELARSGGGTAGAGGIQGLFVSAYAFVGVPLTLETAIIGVASVMTVRFTSSFLMAWLQATLSTNYERYLKTNAFERALMAEVSYFDESGSDEVLNLIVTEARSAGSMIQYVVNVLKTSFLILMYLSIAFYLTPALTVFTLVVFGGVTYLTRNVLEAGYAVGERVADANQRVQSAVQAGTQGIRDVKLFGLSAELFSNFQGAINQYVDANIKRLRNKAAIRNFYDLATAVTVFALIYLAFMFTSLTLGALGLFLFAMFRLSPLVSTVNSQVYNVESHLSHLVRTQQFIEDLSGRAEECGHEPAPNPVESLEFVDVHFSYESSDPVLKGISFEVNRDEFIAFVGQSGAGKSTIVSLLTRMYEPDGGKICANDKPVTDMDVGAWRDRIAVVRQNPHIFNDTLRNNVTIGNRDADEAELKTVCEIARVDEFLETLPDGYDSLLGDDGVRLSGGQRQRVALARALLKDADVLVLDEATSDLDSNLEKEVQRAIEAMERDYLMIAIAHRLSTVRNADRIYTIEAGEITEVGEHQEMIENDGKYAELYAVQSQDQ